MENSLELTINSSIEKIIRAVPANGSITYSTHKTASVERSIFGFPKKNAKNLRITTVTIDIVETLNYP